MKAKFIIPILAVLSMNSCDAQKKGKTAVKQSVETATTTTIESTNSNPTRGNITRLREGENTFLKDAQMNITFIRIVQDSRCAPDVQCVWAGNATVEIELMATTSRPARFQISIGDLKKELSNSVEFNGYRVSLEKLISADSKEGKGKYAADFVVEKATN